MSESSPSDSNRVRRVLARWLARPRSGPLHDAFFGMWLRFHGVECGSDLHLEGKFPAIINEGKMRLGNRVVIRAPIHRTELSTGHGARLTIGANSYINQGSTISASQLIEIGERCLIGEFVAIHDSNFHPLQPGELIRTAPIRIGHNVWIGHRATILAGVTIGDHAVIGAGAIVTRVVPPRTVVGGVPAKVIRTFDCPDDWRRP